MEASDLDTLLLPPTTDKKKDDEEEAEEDEDYFKTTSHKLELYVNYIFHMNGNKEPSRDSYKLGSAYEARRALIKQVFVNAIKKNFCGKCSA
jgi:hypothetical protein